MRAATLLFICCASMALVCAETPPPTIDEVAGEQLHLLHTDDDWRIFSITIPPGGTLADHASGPRAIVTLTELEIQALSGDTEPRSVEPWQAMWLTNTFSRGFANIGDDALRYLVIEARDRGVEAEDAGRDCGAGSPLLANSLLSICRIEDRADGVIIELDHPSWLYSADPIFTDRNANHSMLAAGVHTLLAADSPVLIVSVH